MLLCREVSVPVFQQPGCPALSHPISLFGSKTMTVRLLLAVTIAIGCLPGLLRAEPAFRTDGGDEKLPWFQLKPGEFPPEGSAHHLAGELIALDHVNRAGMLRWDRDASQTEFDRAHPFTMLPYGSLRYHGALAELRDIPIGTHLHGQFYFDEKAGKDGKGAFTQALRLEDDFSFDTHRQRQWRVDGIALDKGTLTVTLIGPADDQADARATVFRIDPSTRVWKGRCIGALSDLAVGQTVLVNLTVCTILAPGRCTEIWLDQDSRQVATAHQLAVHHRYLREHGLACIVDEVDNQQQIVTATLFDGFDPALLVDFKENGGLTAAVAEERLRTYDQGGDSANGPILQVTQGPTAPGSSGIRIRFKPALFLEGHRPGRILRLFGTGWRVDSLPFEEQAYDH